MTTITRLLLLAASLFFSTFSLGQTRYYVNAAATGNNNGLSWQNAYTDLQSALIAAQNGNEIWVAKGTYHPTPTTDQSIYFELKNQAKLYGGFAGGESQLSERDWTTNETVLSGDIGVQGDSSDNSYHILYIGKSDTTTIVDGFVFREGNADSAYLANNLNSSSGAALYIFSALFEYAYPKILNCKFEHNYAGSGSAVFIGSNGMVSSAGPHFENCLFQFNRAYGQGGAVRKYGHSSVNIKDDFLNCTFENNIGGALTCTFAFSAKDTFEIVGCNFDSNQGKAIFLDEQTNLKNEGKIEIRDCNFIGNQAVAGAGISIFGHPASLSITNSNFIGNLGTSQPISRAAAISIYFNAPPPIYITPFELDISQCVIEENSSNESVIELHGDSDDIVFTKVSFRDNLFRKNSNGIYLINLNSVEVSDCIFEESGKQGNNFFNNDADKTVIANSIFANNKGIFYDQTNPYSIDTISNCTFYNNLGNATSSFVDGNALITNCIFHQEIEGNAFPFQAANVTLENSLILSPDCSTLPAFVTCGPGNIFGLEPIFADTAAGDFHLSPTSPGAGAGDNNIVNELGILTDLDGNPRIQGGTVDMGAYESDFGSNSAGVKYVNTNVQGGNNDGTSWANAYIDLKDALTASQYGDEIWVAQGTYYPTISTDRSISFELKDGVKLYGGFAGIEAQLSQRDWVANETVLSGDIGIPGDSTDNTYSILFIGVSDATTIVDGLIFKNGNADFPTSGGALNKSNGAAIYISSDIYYAYPKILNCKFENNHAIKSGGAVYIINGSQSSSAAPHFQNCLFKFNSADGEGGAIYKYGHSLVEIKDDILNCTFENNSALGGGAISYTSYLPKNDTFEIVGCNFISNHAIQRGGGISLLAIYSQINEEKIEIRDCDFTNNQGRSGGAIGMASNPSSLSITNSNFVGNLDTNSPNSFGAALAIFYGDQFLQDTNTFDLDISHCLFDNNNSINSVIFLSNGNSLNNITKLSFKYNLVKNNSAGFVFNPFSSSTITNCIFEKNGSQVNNFILTSYCHRTAISNSIFLNNKGILYNQGNQAATDTITNCTFYNNIGDTTATQLFGNALISNCIFNQEIAGNAFPFQAANVTLENSLILSPDCSNLPAYVTCGADNIFGHVPVFADTAGGDFHILPTSPGINAGNNDVVNALGIQTDYDGNPRIKFCNVDKGAFEAPDYSLLLQSSSTNTPCANQADGAVQFQLLNGCTSYSYEWTKGQESGTGSTGLFPGNYAFTITDALGKAIETQIEIPALPNVEITATAMDYNCANGTAGNIALTPTNGVPPFEYQWTDGSTSPNLEQLSPGNYAVTIADANGCSIIDTINVGAQGVFPVGISISPITCAGDSDGSATLQPIGGTMPFTWLWQGGQMSPTLDSLSGGTYLATVTDALGCTGDIEFTITPPSPVAVDITVMQPLCFGKMGIATANGSGGTGNLHFLWDNGATTASTMLSEGPHTVTVTDASGCSTVETVTIQAPPQLQVSLSVEPDMLCFGASNGTIIVTPSGGSGQYGWNGPIENLSAGTYTITVTDSNGCTAISETTIAQHPDITVTDTVMDASTPTASDGSVVLNSVSGGTGSGYQFNWSLAGSGNVISTEQNLTGVPTGDYSLTVTDSQGCTAVFNFFVDFNSAAGEAAANPFGAAIVPNPSGKAGASVLLKANTISLKISVFDAVGRMVIAEQASGSRFALPKGLAAGSYRIVLENGKERMVLNWVVGE